MDMTYAMRGERQERADKALTMTMIRAGHQTDDYRTGAGQGEARAGPCFEQLQEAFRERPRA